MPSYEDQEISDLESKARQIRRDIVDMIYHARSGHLGGSLSIVEILVALYYRILRIDPANPQLDDRDRFILSKGHAAPALYATLAERGFFEKGLLKTSFRTYGGLLEGHPDMKKTPGIDATSGSLGIGLSVGCGMALGAKILNRPFKTYVLLGDGEINEGQIWEAAMTAVHYQLGNLAVFVDVNGQQNDGTTDEIKSLDPLTDKWRAFGWNVKEADGHCFEEILRAVNASEGSGQVPSVIICKTVKGKGVSFMENETKFHGFSLDEDQYRRAMSELSSG